LHTAFSNLKFALVQNIKNFSEVLNLSINGRCFIAAAI